MRLRTRHLASTVCDFSSLIAPGPSHISGHPTQPCAKSSAWIGKCLWWDLVGCDCRNHSRLQGQRIHSLEGRRPPELYNCTLSEGSAWYHRNCWGQVQNFLCRDPEQIRGRLNFSPLLFESHIVPDALEYAEQESSSHC